MSKQTEVFRFVSIRGIQRASSESLKGRLILCDTSADEVDGEIMRPVTNRAEALKAARDFVSSGSLVEDLGSLEIPIAALDGWLLDRGDSVEPEKAKKTVLSQTGAKSLDVLVSGNLYKTDRRRVSVSLSSLTILPDGNERLRTQLLRAMHIFGLIEELAKTPSVLSSKDEVFAFLAFATVILPGNFPVPAEALARPPAIADLKVVRQKLLRYQTGEIAHIENVLKGESKSRVHRRKDLSEETVTTETERETSEERELQTSEQFEMQQESSRLIKDDVHVDAGATISASYGPTVSATVTAGFEMNHSQEESKRTATNFARQVMERSANRIRERVRTQRTTRTLREIEETNTHGIDNKSGRGHVVGIYRYVDKLYEAQIYNYGKRLMLEFVVPEPAAFVRQLMAVPTNIGVEPPPKPEVVFGTAGARRPLEPADITRQSYLSWAAKYYVQDVTPPPEETVWIPLGWEEAARPDTGITPATPARKIYKVNQTLEIPAGYVAKQVNGIIGVSDWQNNVMISVADTPFTLTQAYPAGSQGAYTLAFRFSQALANSPRGKLPIGLVIENCWGYEITLQVKCDLVPEGFQKWQLESFNQIMRAYFELKSIYEEKLTAADIQRGVAIQGRHPDENRRIERTELKKHVISMLQQHHFDQPPVDQEAIDYQTSIFHGYNEIKFDVASRERNYIQWFEQAFEWQNMTYVFYPYYWSRKFNWKEDVLGQDTDPLFNSFLRAGAARVVVPVRPRFEKAVGLYLASGIIWNGNQAPQVGDPLFVSAIQEIQEQQGAPDGGVAEGDPWRFTLPTPLVILQEDGKL